MNRQKRFRELFRFCKDIQILSLKMWGLFGQRGWGSLVREGGAHWLERVVIIFLRGWGSLVSEGGDNFLERVGLIG